MGELAWELEVSRRTIMNDVMLLSFDYDGSIIGLN